MKLLYASAFAAFFMPTGTGDVMLNPNVNQDNIASTICRPGWTKTVRPEASKTNALKHKLLPHGAKMLDYELDHFVPLELGGAPFARENLWLQPWNGPCGAHAKDKDERELNRLVCEGKASLVEAQNSIRLKWEHCRK